jgi:PucR C-terminal helix-turn-helix domain
MTRRGRGTRRRWPGRSGQRVGAFIETLARYQDIVVEDEDQNDFPTIPPGVMARDWFDTRLPGTALHDGPFADVGHSTSLAHLRLALVPRLVHDGLDDLDGSDLRRRAQCSFTQGCRATSSSTPTETAKAVHLERQSLLYRRLSRIQALLGTNLHDKDTLLGLHLALGARRLLDDAER